MEARDCFVTYATVCRRMDWLRIYRAATRAVLCMTTLGAMSFPVWPQQKSRDLTDESLENLMNIEVTSASKKEQKLSDVAAAIFVITADDIIRSGATNIPDLLRMVPGMQVAETNSNTWGISARGFNGQFSDKLLVLIDGRTIYSPIFPACFGTHKRYRLKRSSESR
jgi:iron complex outermembrane recepter protein